MPVSTVVKNGTRTRYPGRVREFAKRLYDNGRSISEVKWELKKRGYDPSWSTVTYWCKPEFAEAHNFKQTQRRYPAHSRKARELAWWAKRKRMRELREVGLSFNAISKVIRLDFGLDLNAGQVEGILTGATSSKGTRALLDGKTTDGRAA